MAQPPNRKTYTFATPDSLRKAIEDSKITNDAPDLVNVIYSPRPPTDISIAGNFIMAPDVWSGIDSSGLVEYPQHQQQITISPQAGAFIDEAARDAYATDYADVQVPNTTGIMAQFNWADAYIDGQAEYDELYPSITGQTFEEWITELIPQVTNVTNDGRHGFKNLKFVNEIPHITKDFSLTTDPVVFEQQLVPTVNQEFILNFTGNPVIDRKYEQAASSDAISELQLLNFYEKNAMVTNVNDMEIYIDNYLVPGSTPATVWENIIVPYNNFAGLMDLNNVYRVDWPVEAIVNPGLVLRHDHPRTIRNAIGAQDLDLALVNTIMLYTEEESAATSKSDLQTRLDAITWNHLGLEQSLDVETLDVVHESYIEYSTLGAPLAIPEESIINSTVNAALLNLDPWAQNLSDLMDAARWTGTTYHSKPLVGGYAVNLPITNDSHNIVYDSNFDIASLNDYIEQFIENVTNTLTNFSYTDGIGYYEYIKSYKEIISNNPDYSEVILYKIEKRSDPNSLIPLQTFWIQSGWYPSSSPPEGSPIQYIDTQVKFGKNYFYRVFAYNVVIGTRYYYTYQYPADYLDEATTIPPDEDYCPEAPTGWDGLAYAALFEQHYHTIDNWMVSEAYQDFFTAGVPSGTPALFPHGHGYGGGAATSNQDPASTTAWNGDSGAIILDAASLQLFLSIQAGTTTVSGYGGAVQLTGRTMGVNITSTGGGTVVDHYHRVSISVGDQSLPGEGVTKIADICHGTWESGETTIPAGTTSILDSDGNAVFSVTTAPTVQLIQTHLFDFNGAILSLPPTAPDVFFIPYIGIDNKITLSMHAQLGEYKKEAVILDSADADYIDLLRTSNGLGPTDPITYKTDDEVAGFEIYRTETKPSTYEDFSGKFRNSISTLQRSSFQYVYAWDTAYKDEITPNKV